MPNTEMLTNVQTGEMPNYEREIIRIIRGNDTPPVMKDKLMAYHENSIAAALSDMSVSERQRLYGFLMLTICLMLSSMPKKAPFRATWKRWILKRK